MCVIDYPLIFQSHSNFKTRSSRGVASFLGNHMREPDFLSYLFKYTKFVCCFMKFLGEVSKKI